MHAVGHLFSSLCLVNAKFKDLDVDRKKVTLNHLKKKSFG